VLVVVSYTDKNVFKYSWNKVVERIVFVLFWVTMEAEAGVAIHC